MANKAEILDAIAGMTVLELSELIKEMEEKFGVSAAAAAVAVAAPAAGAPAAAVEEQTEFTVMLTEIGANKVSVIKAVRGDGFEGRVQQFDVVAVRAIDHPADRDPVRVDRDGPLPPEFGSVSGVRAGALAAVGGLVE